MDNFYNHNDDTFSKPLIRISNLLPCLIPLTIVTKLSSNKTMLAASLLISLPQTPIATPKWAALRAGASLTPSPGAPPSWTVQPLECDADACN
uniref:Uncharacterized protein n=1 Tax=Romanomermis culicivorax TaxID=13658 RepID=A0A915INE2_ROMCU